MKIRLFLFAIVVVLVLVRGLVPALAHTVVIVLVLDLVLVLVAVVFILLPVCAYSAMEARSDCQAITRHKKSNAPYAAAGARRRSIGLFCALAEAYQNAKTGHYTENQEHFAFGACCLRTREFGELL